MSVKDENIKIRQEDLQRLSDALVKDCKGSPVIIKIEWPLIRFITKTIHQEHIEYVIRDEEKYMGPTKIKEEKI